jgi:hypothetical protein
MNKNSIPFSAYFPENKPKMSILIINQKILGIKKAAPLRAAF